MGPDVLVDDDGPPLPQVNLQGGEELEYGLCLWSCGNSARPLVQDLVAQVPEQVSAPRSEWAPAPGPPQAFVWSAPFVASDTLPLGNLAALFAQSAFQRGGTGSRKLAVDKFMRVIGARDTVALGDCSMVAGAPLPPTAQVRWGLQRGGGGCSVVAGAPHRLLVLGMAERDAHLGGDGRRMGVEVWCSAGSE